MNICDSKKIVIVGCPASGKSTLAKKMGIVLDIPVHHLDKIFWVEEKGIKQDVFIAQQEEMMRGDKWIIDGDFRKSKSFDLRLSNADTIIFFEFSKIIIYYRLIKRFIKYFNKLRPDRAGNIKYHLTWHLIKLIWKFPAEEVRSKVLEYIKTKNVIILHNLKEEYSFLKSLKSCVKVSL